MKTVVSAVSIAAGRLGGLWGAGTYIAATVFVVAAALLEKRVLGASEAVDSVLTGAVFGWTIPLLAYAAVARVARYGRLDDASHELARHGGNRRTAVACFVLMTAARVGVVGGLLSALTVLVASDGGASAIRADALTTGWIGALGGIAYVTWFSLGSLWGKAGRGRFVALAVDWAFGATASVISVPWPRAHLRSLLGGELVLGMPSWQSSVSLGLLAGLYFLACVGRVAR